MKMKHQNDRTFVQSAMERLRQLVTHQTHKHGYRHTPGIVTMTNTCERCRNITGIDKRPIFINNYGYGDTVRERVVICTPWSYLSTLHALTVINISNQSPCCLNTCEPCFSWTREMQNWALMQAPGTPEARPQRPKPPLRRTRPAEPRHTEANAANSIPSGLETRSGDPRAAGGHLPHDACEARPTFGVGGQSGHGTLRDQIEGWTAANGRAARLRMGCHDDGFDHGPSTLLRRQAENGGIHVQRKFTGSSFADNLLEPVQKNISERLGQVAVFRAHPDSAHLVSHHQIHESEESQREVRPSSSREQRARTPTNARRSITQAGDKRRRQQSLTSWLRPKTPRTVRSSTEDNRGRQRLLTSWIRPKSSPAPAVYAAPCRGIHLSRSSRHSQRVSSCGYVHLSRSSGDICMPLLLRFGPHWLPWWRTSLQHQP